MPPTPINSELILIPFLCGSLVLSFILAALGAVFKVYRPLVPISERLRKLFAKSVPEPGPEASQNMTTTRVELVDNGFQGRESVLRGNLGMTRSTFDEVNSLARMQRLIYNAMGGLCSVSTAGCLKKFDITVIYA